MSICPVPTGTSMSGVPTPAPAVTGTPFLRSLRCRLVTRDPSCSMSRTGIGPPVKRVEDVHLNGHLRRVRCADERVEERAFLRRDELVAVAVVAEAYACAVGRLTDAIEQVGRSQRDVASEARVMGNPRTHHPTWRPSTLPRRGRRADRLANARSPCARTGSADRPRPEPCGSRGAVCPQRPAPSTSRKPIAATLAKVPGKILGQVLAQAPKLQTDGAVKGAVDLDAGRSG